MNFWSKHCDQVSDMNLQTQSKSFAMEVSNILTHGSFLVQKVEKWPQGNYIAEDHEDWQCLTFVGIELNKIIWYL